MLLAGNIMQKVKKELTRYGSDFFKVSTLFFSHLSSVSSALTRFVLSVSLKLYFVATIIVLFQKLLLKILPNNLNMELQFASHLACVLSLTTTKTWTCLILFFRSSTSLSIWSTSSLISFTPKPGVSMIVTRLPVNIQTVGWVDTTFFWYLDTWIPWILLFLDTWIFVYYGYQISTLSR